MQLLVYLWSNYPLSSFVISPLSLPLIFVFFQDIHKSVDQNPFLAASNYPFKEIVGL